MAVGHSKCMWVGSDFRQMKANTSCAILCLGIKISAMVLNCSTAM